MPDQPKKPHSISEISHLFLSTVREKQTGSAPRPVRVPPQARENNGQRAVASGQSNNSANSELSMTNPPSSLPTAHCPPPTSSIDLTPEEYAQVAGQSDPAERVAAGEGTAPIPPVTAVIAQHLNGRAPERVRDYARHLAANGERIGLLEVEAGEMRLM